MASSTPGTVPPDRVIPITRHPPSSASFAAIARPMIPVAPTTTTAVAVVVDSFGMIRDPPLNEFSLVRQFRVR